MKKVNIFSMIKQRVLQVIDLKGVKKEDFFNEIGMTSANFRGKAKETPLNSTAIENIFTVVPDLNMEWLITGKGEILKSKNALAGNTSLEATVRNQQILIDELYSAIDIIATKLEISKDVLFSRGKNKG